jgi:hypothetical protein
MRILSASQRSDLKLERVMIILPMGPHKWIEGAGCEPVRSKIGSALAIPAAYVVADIRISESARFSMALNSVAGQHPSLFVSIAKCLH